MIDPYTVKTVASFLRPRTWRRLRWALIAYAAAFAIYTLASSPGSEEGEVFGGFIVVAFTLFCARLCGRAARKLEAARDVVLGMPSPSGGAIVSKQMGFTLLLVTRTGLDMNAAARLVKDVFDEHGLLYVESDYMPKGLHFMVVNTSSSVAVRLFPEGDSDCTLDVNTASNSRTFNAEILEMLIVAFDAGSARLSAVSPNDRSFLRSVKERDSAQAASPTQSIRSGERLLGSVRGELENTGDLHVLGVSHSTAYHWHHRARPIPSSTVLKAVPLQAISGVKAEQYGQGVRLTVGWQDGAVETVADVTNGKLDALLSGLRAGGVPLLDATEGLAQERIPGFN